MRTLLAILASALGGFIALIAFMTLIGLLGTFITDGTAFALICSIGFGALTGILKFCFDIRANDLKMLLHINFIIAIGFSILVTLQVLASILSVSDIPMAIYMIVVYFSTFGTIPGLAYYAVIALLPKKEQQPE